MLNTKISIIYTFCWFVLLINVSCKNTREQQQTLNSNSQTKIDNEIITKIDIENLEYTDYVLSEASKTTISDWAKFFEIEAQLDLLKNGDLTFFIDNNAALVSLLEDFKNDLPYSINDNTIIVRLKVIESLFYRLEDLINYKPPKQEIIAIIKDILIANSNLIDQINKKIEKDQQKINNPF